MTTPFELFYRLKPRTPSFPGSDIERLLYGESFTAERLQILQSARKIAKQNFDEKLQNTKYSLTKILSTISLLLVI